MPYSTIINTFCFSLVLPAFITLVACGDLDEAALPGSAPVANAGTDQTPLLGNMVTLDGSASSDVDIIASGDADSDMLAYRWSFLLVPPGSGATLSNTAAVNPSFTIDVLGDYVLQLIVNDGTVDSTPDTVSVSTN